MIETVILPEAITFYFKAAMLFFIAFFAILIMREALKKPKVQKYTLTCSLFGRGGNYKYRRTTK